MPTVGWGVRIQGEPMDLAAWGHALKEPFDPWVETHGTETVLGSSSLDKLDTLSEVRDRAIVCIDRLNGAMALSQQVRPVRYGGLIRFEPNGSLTQFLEAALFEASSFIMPPTVTVIGPDGQPIPPPPPQPSEVQRWMMHAAADSKLGEALVFFQKDTMPDFYKAIESLVQRFGGKQEGALDRFLKLNWAPSDDVKLLRRMTNWPRHARRENVAPPEPEMTHQEARQLLGQLIRRAFEETARTSHGRGERTGASCRLPGAP